MKTQSQWDNAADWFDQNMGSGGDELNSKIIDPFISISLGDTSSKAILDSGCGNGYLAAGFAAKAKRVIGTDFAGNFVKLCQKKYANIVNLEFLQYDVTKPMPFADNFFDIVLSKMVLQYVPEISTFAKESYRVLGDSGKLVVVIDHPFHTQFYFAQQVVGKPNPKYPTLHDYFDKSEQTKLSLWGKVELAWYPRKVSDYIMPFIERGYTLKTINELCEMVNNTKVPRILGLVFQK